MTPTAALPERELDVPAWEDIKTCAPDPAAPGRYLHEPQDWGFPRRPDLQDMLSFRGAATPQPPPQQPPLLRTPGAAQGRLAAHTETDAGTLWTRNARGADNTAGPQHLETYPDHVERQQAARCGMHSLSYAVGHSLHNAANMTFACNIYLQEARHEGLMEVRGLHERAGGGYSREVMAKAVTTTCMRKHGRVQHIMRLEPLHVNPASLRTSLGAVANIENVHWVALRWLDGRVWLLDSQEPWPVSFTWLDYLDFIGKHKDVYRIEFAPANAAATSSAEVE